jgi:hypothetical protein
VRPTAATATRSSTSARVPGSARTAIRCARVAS